MANNQKATPECRSFGLQTEKKKMVSKWKPKLREQDEAPLPPPSMYTLKNSFLGELCSKYTLLGIFFFLNFMEERARAIRMWCLSKSSTTSSELSDQLHTYITVLRCRASLSTVIFPFFSQLQRRKTLMTVIKQKNIRCNGTFCMLAKPLWFKRSCFFSAPAVYSL